MISNWLVRFRYWILGATLLLAALSGVLMFYVNINTDMTKYLPNDSHMRAGLEIMQQEFGLSTDMAGADVRVMTQGQTEEEKVDMRYQLHQLPEVNNVNIQENGNHTLYELGVAKSVDQITLGKYITENFDKVEVVETAQDGTTADAPMLIGALALLLIVLAAMCASWLEPVLFLASTGIAVLLNSGTNALLPSVSMTTHSIAAILQLVLSMDYSIILINRYRQERSSNPSSTEAMQLAIRRAAPSILSSALTTTVGLMMLVFMKLKIGAVQPDMQFHHPAIADSSFRKWYQQDSEKSAVAAHRKACSVQHEISYPPGNLLLVAHWQFLLPPQSDPDFVPQRTGVAHQRILPQEEPRSADLRQCR